MPRRISDLEGRDAYELLGVATTASEQEIRRAYRRVMLTTHPDRGGAEHLAKLVNCARELLLDDRESYDRHRRQLAATRAAAQAPTAARERESDWAAWEAETRAPVRRPAPSEPARPWQSTSIDDVRFTPYTPRRARLRELSWGDRLMNGPMMLGALLAIGVVVGVIAALTAAPAPGPTQMSSTQMSPAQVGPAQGPSQVSPDGTSSAGTGSAPTTDPGAQTSLTPDHVCGVSASGYLWCSGANDVGQLGVGDPYDHAGPVTPAGGPATWLSVAAFRTLTCGVGGDHRLYCWGAAPRPGQGEPVGSLVPRPFGTGTTWTSVTVSSSHLCASGSAGARTCFPA